MDLAGGLKSPYLGADRDLVEDLVASTRLYFNIESRPVLCGVLKYWYLREVARIGTTLFVGSLLCLDIRRPKPSRYF